MKKSVDFVNIKNKVLYISNKGDYLIMESEFISINKNSLDEFEDVSFELYNLIIDMYKSGISMPDDITDIFAKFNRTFATLHKSPVKDIC